MPLLQNVAPPTSAFAMPLHKEEKKKRNADTKDFFKKPSPSYSTGLLEKQLRSLTSLLSQASLFLSVVPVHSLRLRSL